MEFTFNEISQTPLSDNKYMANELMLLFSQTVSEARKKGFRKIRSHFAANEIKLTGDYTFRDWMFDKSFPAVYRELFLDMFIHPFLKEDDEVENEYIEADFYFEDAENQIPKQTCLGLTSAYLSETLSASFQNSPAWLKNSLNIIIEKGENVSTGKVFNVHSKECFSQESITNFIESIIDLNLVETNIKPNDKNFHLTAHHGQQELNDLWNRIKNSPYVIGGISIEWGGNSFYKNPRKDGKLDIVHLKSDRRYVMQIQTTGRNLRETIEIGKILKNLFG